MMFSRFDRGAALAIGSALAILMLAPISVQAATGGLAYVRASSQLDAATNRGQYHPLNLLDDDPSTIWCEGADGVGEGESIQVFFKKPQKVNRISITPTPSSGRMVEAVRISDGRKSVLVHVGE